jgi:cytoskeletal protein CcmA (bactofilin family)
MWKKPVESEASSQETLSPDPAPRAAPVSGPSAGVSTGPAMSSRQSGSSVIGDSITLRGDISGEENLIVKGNIEGTLNFPNNDIQIDPEGRVKADLMAQKISVAGKVRGNLNGSERVIIQKSGEVEGNIVASRVVLEDGCKFKGSVEMNIDSGSSSKLAKLGGSKEKVPVSGAAPGTAKSPPNSGTTRAAGST